MSKKNRNRQQQEMAPSHVEMPVQEQAAKVDFDAWFVMRGSKIPKAHRKEIIKADFRGRGLTQLESLEAFDAALAKYGIKLA